MSRSTLAPVLLNLVKTRRVKGTVVEVTGDRATVQIAGYSNRHNIRVIGGPVKAGEIVDVEWNGFEPVIFAVGKGVSSSSVIESGAINSQIPQPGYWEMAGWNITDAGVIYHDGGNYRINPTKPSLEMGNATGYMTGIGIFMGKSSGYYSAHIGDPGGQHLSFNGQTGALNITGSFTGIITGTDSNTFTINQDLGNNDVDLVFGRTTGGSGIIRWTHDGTNCVFRVNPGMDNADFRISGDTQANLFFLDASTDRIGIGINNPSCVFDVNGDVRLRGNVSMLDGTPQTNDRVYIFKNGGITANSKLLYVLYNMNLTGSNNFSVNAMSYKASTGSSEAGWQLSGFSGIDSAVTLFVAGTLSNLTGVTSRAYWYPGVTGGVITSGTGYNAMLDAEDSTITTGKGIYIKHEVNTGAFTTSYGVHYDTPGTGTSILGTIYGIYIGDIASKASSPFALYTLSGNIVFNENGAASYMRVEGDTNTHLLYIDGTNDRIGVNASSPSAKLHVIHTSEQFRLGYDASNYASFTVNSSGNLLFAPTGDIVFDPTGNDILPQTNYDLNLGSLNKKYLSLHAAELWVETLVAQQTIATIGGRILVGPTTVLTSDLTASITDRYLWVKHNQQSIGDVPYMEANGKVEFMYIDGFQVVSLDATNDIFFITGDHTNIFKSGVKFRVKKSTYYQGLWTCRQDSEYSGITGRTAIYVSENLQSTTVDSNIDYATSNDATGPYLYYVTRNYDGSGANDWYAGDAVFNTGAMGNGFIDIYSIQGVKGGTQYGPTIVGNVRNSEAYNDWTEHWAIGNLNGLYGKSTNVYGVGLGKYGGGNYIVITATNGVEFFNSSNIRVGQLTGTTWTLGVGNSQRVSITNTQLEMYDSSNQKLFELSNANGINIYDTNGLARVVITSQQIAFYRATNERGFIANSNGVYLGNYDVGNYIRVDTFGNMTFNSNGATRGTISSAGSFWFGNSSITERLSWDSTNGLVMYNRTGATVIQFDTSGNVDILNKLRMPGTSSAIAIGSTPPTSSSSGTGIWIDRTGIYGLNSNVLQAKLSATDGKITAGAGDVILDYNGISINASNIGNNLGKLVFPGTLSDIGYIEAYQGTAVNNYFLIEAKTHNSIASDLILRATGNIYLTSPGQVMDQGANDGKILQFKSSDVAHGITSYAETDTYGYFQKADASRGGLLMTGLVETGTYGALVLLGGATDGDTTKSSAARAPIRLNAARKSGTTLGAMGTNENLLTVEDANGTRFIVDKEGDLHVDGSTSLSGYDDYDDLALIRGFELSLTAKDVDRSFREWINSQRDKLIELGILSEGNFINVTRLQRLQNGALWQLHQRLEKLEGKLV